MMTRQNSSRPSLSAAPRRPWWSKLLIAGLLFLAGYFTVQGLRGSPVSEQPREVATARAVSQPRTIAIEQIRVGQRVWAENPESQASADEASAVDPTTWRKVVLRGEDRWPDGTLDVIEAETLQPPEWLAAFNVRVGATIPFPLDLHEMGLPDDLMAVVQAIDPCPPLAPSPGRLVLATVNHLNLDVWELRFRDASGHEEAVRPTGAHKFYSLTRSAWVSAATLQPDEILPGILGQIHVVSVAPLPGVHRVYNMTVEGEHVYHVSTLGVVAHNHFW